MPFRFARRARSRSSVRRTISRWALVLALLLTLLPVSPSAAAPAAQDSSINISILPINNARLLAGQRFDLRIEVSGALQDNTDPATFTVTVDGRPLAQYFGKAPEKSNTTPQSAELTLRNVAFTTPGQHVVRVAAGPVASSVTYTVLRVPPQGPRAKNVILFVGDGMPWQMVTIARIVSRGLTQGRFNGRLEMDTMDAVGYVSTSGYDSLATDSANSMSAYTTGQKGVVNSLGIYEDNTASPSDDPRVENINEILKRTRNMAVGIVSTSEIENATPAAVVAHTRRRAEKMRTVINRVGSHLAPALRWVRWLA